MISSILMRSVFLTAMKNELTWATPRLELGQIMQLAKVIGRATSTVKHPTLKGWRMLLVQPLDPVGAPDGAPQLVIDNLGGGKGDTVMISSDGKTAREMVGSDNTPARWHVLGIVD